MKIVLLTLILILSISTYQKENKEIINKYDVNSYEYLSFMKGL